MLCTNLPVWDEKLPTLKKLTVNVVWELVSRKHSYQEHRNPQTHETHSCEQFLYIKILINLPHTYMYDSNIFTLESPVLDKCVITDKSKHWSFLLYKE